MKKEQLFDAICGVDDKLIEHSDKKVYRQMLNKSIDRFSGRGIDGGAFVQRIHRHNLGIRFTAIAACLVMISVIGINVASNIVTTSDNLPMLEVSAPQSGAMGFEGYMAYNASEFVNKNTWSDDADITSLPIYENTLEFYSDYRVANADFDQMKAFLLDIADRLGMDTENLEIKDDVPDAETKTVITEKFGGAVGAVPEGYFDPTMIFAEKDGVKIEVDTKMTAAIYFDKPVSLPNEYNFSEHASYDEMSKAAEYLKEKYSKLICMENPQANIHGGDYNIYAQQSYKLSFFNSVGDVTQQIINYNFNNVTFYSDDNGNLYMIRVYRTDLSHKVGDYPIITAKEAKKLLKNGNYITTVPEKMPGEKYIEKVELVYRNDSYVKYFMPYYRFIVELPDMETDNGLKSYGAYYVPAVKKQYISNMPAWDGTFN